MILKKERRSDIDVGGGKTLGLQLRSEGGKNTLFGYAAVFNTFSSDLGGFREIIRPGAFSRSLKEADVRALWDHATGQILGRTSSGTLRLEEDERGLHYELDVPDTQLGRDLLVLVGRRDVTGSSFGFECREDTWRQEGENVVRELVEVELGDVSPVTYPAYPATEVATRSLQQYRSAVLSISLTRSEQRRRLIALAEAEGR